MSTFQKFFPDLQNYSFDKFKGDLSAGLVTGIVAIPLSLALAIASGVPPIYGLYTAAIAGTVAAFFAGSRFSVSGPAAAIVPVLAGIVSTHGLEALPIIGFLTGLGLLALSVLKLGNLVKYIPLSVTLGFTAGIAILIFFGQVNNFLGLSGIQPHELFHKKLIETVSHLSTTDMPTLLLGMVSFASLLILPKIKLIEKVPASLIVAIVSIVAVMYIPFFSNVKTIEDSFGAIELGLPDFKVPNIRDFYGVAPASSQLVILIAIESLLCAVIADKMTKTKHNSNQELFSQGIANIASSMFLGIPATAVIARTGTSIKNGAQSRFAALIHGIFIIAFLLFLAPIGSQIPLTTLSAILFVTAIKISEYKEIKRMVEIAPTNDVIIMLVALLLTVFFDITLAVGVGMFLATLLIFKNLSTLDIEKFTYKSEFISERLKAFLQKHPDTCLLNLEGNLIMGSAPSWSISDLIEDDDTNIILRLKEIHHVDSSGLEFLENVIESIKHDNRKVYFSSINSKLKRHFEKYGILKDTDGIFANTDEMINNFR